MIVYILCGVIILLVIFHHFERKDLYNRIMSRNLAEYKNKKCTSAKSAHDRLIKRWRGRESENE